MVNVAIIGGEKSGRTSLSSKLGKKGTESDITLYNFNKGDRIYAFIDPTGYPESPKPLVTALNLSDIALLCIPSSGPTAQTGECMVALDLLGFRRGLFVITMTDRSNPAAVEDIKKKIKAIAKDTCMKDWGLVSISTTTFEGMEEMKDMLFKLGEDVVKENVSKAALPPRVITDHFFNVTGIGCVVLGVVKQGTIKVHDNLIVSPIERPVEIRSIQMNDVDVKSATTGDRVGLALKGIQAKDFSRGYIISSNEKKALDFKLKCHLTKFTKGLGVGDAVHLFAGLQSNPAVVKSITLDGADKVSAGPGTDCITSVSVDKEIAYSPDDVFLLLQLNDPKQRFVARGIVS